MKRFIIILIVSFFSVALAQSIPTPHYPYVKYSVDDGLPQSIVSGIIEDSYGFIWVATNEGVARFDGAHFAVYNEETGYPFRLITGIVETKPGEIWVATIGNGLWRLKNDQAQPVIFDSTLQQPQLNFLVKTYDGEILLGSEPGGLYVFKNDSLILHIPGSSATTDNPDAMISATKDYVGRYWIGTFRNGVKVYKKTTLVFKLDVSSGLPSNEIRDIYTRPSGDVWIATPEGIYVYGNSSFTKQWNRLFSHVFISSIFSKDHRNIWIALASSPGGIVHVKDNKIKEIIEGNNTIFTKCTLIDEYGTLFVGSYEGLIIFPNLNFQNFGSSDGLTDKYIRAINRDVDGNLLVATKNDGLFIYKGNKFKKIKAFEKYFSGNSIFEIEPIGDELWIGSARGLFIVKKGKIREISQFHGMTIRRIVLLNGKIFIISKRNVYVSENGKIKNISHNLRKKKHSFWGIEKDKKGNLIIATNGEGVYKLVDTSWVPISVPDSVRKFFGVRKGPDQNLYFPSSQGLLMWDGNTMHNVLKIKRTVWDVIPTKANGVWLLTSKGLYHLLNNKVYIYNKNNGLVTTEFNMGAFCYINDHDIWFGGVDGLVHYKFQKHYPFSDPDLYISSIKSSKHAFYYPFSEKITLKYSEHNIQIYFNKIDFGNMPYYTYGYWLEGLNKDTVKVDNASLDVVRYLNLPDGNYVFHLFLINPFTGQVALKRSVSFTILHPWWKSIPFYFGVLLFSTLIMGLIIRWRESYLKRRNAMLEQQVEERMQDIKLSYKLLKQETEERKKAEISLKKEREQLVVTLRSIADGVIRTDSNGKILLMNDAAERITGYALDEVLHKPLRDILHLTDEESNEPIVLPDDLPKIKKSYSKTNSFNAYLKNDSLKAKKIVNISWSQIRDEQDKESGYVWVIRDISTERKLEAEILRTQKLESIGLLAGGIAHDFNNILSGILGNAQLARMALDKGKDVRKFLVGIEKATENATHLTQQLLTFAKGGEPVKEIINIKDMLYESVEFALRGSSVSAKYNIDENLWPVEADKGQINQVINNLVINAIQAMPGGGQLTLTAKNFVKNGQQNGLEQIEEKFLISISIEDTGHGIPKENLNKIFDPYFTTKQRGSGLGLATTFAIIKKHGGHISVSSELGKGTTFTIYLPACPEKEIKEKIQKTEVKNWQGKRALVMDDEEYIQELMGSFLDMLNISTDFASNGEEAVQKYKQHLEKGEPYDFVIMDLTIRGGMGGKEAVKQILEINPEAKVIVASGYSTDSVLANYKKFGFSGRLSKPFNLEELAEVVNEILSKN